MPDRDSEVFSNPLPPSHHKHEEEDDSHHLTNDDFRKMMMTPKVSGLGGSYSTSTKESSSTDRNLEAHDDEDDAATRRKKKKSYYARLKKEEEDRKKELASKYRDRASERRVGNDYNDSEISTTADYRSVAPDAKAEENYAERRKQMIQESKYLGGDMEHTHLVKGLDYALLEKVRAEISSKEIEQEETMEAVVAKADEEHPEPDPEEQIQFKTKMGRNVYRILFKNKLPDRNELFLPRRMAYVVDLEDEFADSDVPTTFIRSKADCPTLEASTTLTTNDIVINKLTQILSYLRQGRRENKKLKKKDKGKLKDDDKGREKLTGGDDNIFEDIGQYQPLTKSKDKKDRDRDYDRERDYRGDRDRKKDRDRRDRDRERDERDYRDRDGRDRRDRDRDVRDKDRERDRGRDGRDRNERDSGRDRDRDRRDGRDRGREREKDRGRESGREARKSYFEKPVEEDEDHHKPQQTAREMVNSINDKYKSYDHDHGDDDKGKGGREGDDRAKKLKQKTEIDSYAECYPGLMESYDAFDDSDDDADYTKMDTGNKKGPVGRWDFDTQEEYSSYMSNKEALPKAAFQYGVKMADGRRTRRTGPKDEKTKLDRELQQINRILDKRKASGGDGGSKKPKY